MATADYIVLIGYLIGTFCVGLIFTRKNSTASDMFAAGGQSPWWTSGLSAFMTMFSANTFVVWGGIAYKHGMVAVVINLMYGIAALLVGYFVAGKWKKMGIKTPAEFIQLRYGTKTLHFYTWFMMIFRMVGTAGSLYALGVVFVALLGNGVDSGLKTLSMAIIIFGGIVIIYTMLGGLWAVLMTDVLQFIVLNLAVLFVIPLALMKVGGVSAFIDSAPEKFFMPVGGQYTWIFLMGWCAIHFFMIGAEWAFVQRYICVPSAKDAKKGTYLFGILYLVSPLFWLLPPMLWRIQSPIPEDATEEQIRGLAENAYILSCKAVLPPGMLGMMLAAMFSATASMVSSQLNVFSGVLTNDIYRPLKGGAISDKQMISAGRLFTVILGIILIGIALAIPHLGGAERVIVGITELMVVALLAPTLWGLFSRNIGSSAVWITATVSFGAGLLVRYVFEADSTLMKTLTGVILPLVVLLVMQLLSRKTSAGYKKVAALIAEENTHASTGNVAASNLPALIVTWCIAILGVLMLVLTVINQESKIVTGIFGMILLLIATVIGWSTKIAKRT